MSKHKHKNPLVRALIMRKGGVHEKSRSAKRQKAKRKLQQKINQYMASKGSHYFFGKLLFIS